MKLLRFTKSGIYCPQADVYIDPWRKVEKAIITHAHADHARPGMGSYLAHTDSELLLRSRLGKDISIQSLSYAEEIDINGVRISLYPAGHIPGSAQVKLEYKGETWVVSGDYKTENDGLSPAFEAVKCDHFITESTFGLPVYRWPEQKETYQQINEWWRNNLEAGKHSILYAYSLGKAQRVLQGLNEDIGKIAAHPAVLELNQCLEKSGYALKKAVSVEEIQNPKNEKLFIIAPPGAAGGKWLNKFKPRSTAFASGWMAVRGQRRRMNTDKGFIMSDHADWNGLNQAVEATRAENIYVTHGYADTYSRWLREKGCNAQVIKTEFEGDGS